MSIADEQDHARPELGQLAVRTLDSRDGCVVGGSDGVKGFTLLYFVVNHLRGRRRGALLALCAGYDCLIAHAG